MIISIDGIIGVGKSSILEELQRMGERVYLEPFQSNPVLGKFYTNPSRYAALTQAIFFPLRVDLQMAIPSFGRSFMERSAFSDRYAFAHMLKDIMEPEEWEGYKLFFDLFAAKFNLCPDITIIIDDPVELCLERIKARGRKMEEGITLQYLMDLRAAYRMNMHFLGREVIWAGAELGPNWLNGDPEYRAKRILVIVKDYANNT